MEATKTDKFRRFFQDVKKMTLDQFTDKMNWMHSNAWHLCYRQMGEAMDIALQPKQKDEVMKKFRMIATEWDGIQEVTIDFDAISEEDFLEVVEGNKVIGYERMMTLISEHWKKQDPKGALSVGLCYGALEKRKS